MRSPDLTAENRWNLYWRVAALACFGLSALFASNEGRDVAMILWTISTLVISASTVQEVAKQTSKK